MLPNKYLPANPSRVANTLFHISDVLQDPSLLSTYCRYLCILTATMLFAVASFLCCCVLAPVTWAQSSSSSSASPSSTSSASGTIYTIQAENITAKFIDLGARLTSLTVPDRNGNLADVVVGYDTYQGYVQDNATNHTYFGAVVGRYANRIKNGTFTIDGVTSQIPENEHGGEDTLHGGTEGYDGRIWNVTSISNSSITFSLLDTGFEGFPGTVITYASYALSTETLGSSWGTPHPRLTTRLVSIALDQTTPIMLANHIYWNLNAFTSATILNDTSLYMPYSDRYIQIDTIEVPNGTIGAVANYPVLDFTTPKLIGRDIGQAQGLCGYNCTGYDNAFILDRPIDAGATSSAFPVLGLWSEDTG